jgi:hypothetical protein
MLYYFAWSRLCSLANDFLLSAGRSFDKDIFEFSAFSFLGDEIDVRLCFFSDFGSNLYSLGFRQPNPTSSYVMNIRYRSIDNQVGCF